VQLLLAINEIENLKSRKMRKCLPIFILLTCLHVYCDNWTPKSPVGGNKRNDAVGFAINSLGKGYVGGGGDGVGGYLNDFWEYNPSTDIWIQKANYPGAGRIGLVGFSIGNKGYVGGGATGTSMAQDFWEYDPNTNSWTQKANLPAGKRCYSFSFSIGTKGYIGAGWDASYTPTSDFWEYDVVTNTWTQKSNYGGGVTTRGVGISTSTKGYACMGYPSANSNFWEYNPASNIWTQRANVAGPMYADVVGFSICEKIYIGTGESNDSTGITNELWEYEPANNIWAKKANFIGSARDEAVGFSLLGKGYLGTGSFGLTDWFEYSPDICNMTAVPSFENNKELVRHYPSPFHDKLSLQTLLNGPTELFIYDIFAKLILTEKFIGSMNLNTEQLTPGIYFYEIRDKNGNQWKEKIIKN
jgi:hypothetical protein